MERGSLGGRALFVPLDEEQQYQQAPQQQGGSYQPQVDMKDPLAVRRKLTSDYYNNYALLKRIVEDASKQGIDPFQPDYSQDGGGLAFQAAQEAEANVMYAANLLQNEFKAETQVNDARLRGDARYKQGFDPTSQLISQTPDAAFSTQLDPRVVAANQRTGQSVYTQGDANRVNAAVYDPANQALQNSNLSPEELQYQQGGLFKSVPETAYQQLIPPRTGKSSSEVEVLKKMTNLSQGVWPDGTFNMTTRGGRTFLENKSFAGEYMGDYHGTDAKGNPKVYRRILKRWVKDPDTGEVSIEFDDPNIPKEVVSNMKGDVIASSLITNNPKYGSASKMYESAREAGLLDDTSSARNEAIIAPEADTIRQMGSTKAKAETGVTEKYGVVKKELQALSNPVLGHNWKTYALPDGRELQVAKHKGGSGKFFIKNWEELFSGGSEADFENLTLDAALAYLDDFNYFDKFLGKSSNPVAQPQSTTLPVGTTYTEGGWGTMTWNGKDWIEADGNVSAFSEDFKKKSIDHWRSHPNVKIPGQTGSRAAQIKAKYGLK